MDKIKKYAKGKKYLVPVDENLQRNTKMKLTDIIEKTRNLCYVMSDKFINKKKQDFSVNYKY